MISTKEKNDILHIGFTVETLDASNSKVFKEEAVSICERNTRVVIDMSNISFVDSSGLGAILSCLRAVNSNNGQLKLFGISKTVRTLFELVRMHKLFEIFNTEEEATASFQS